MNENSASSIFPWITITIEKTKSWNGFTVIALLFPFFPLSRKVQGKLKSHKRLLFAETTPESIISRRYRVEKSFIDRQKKNRTHVITKPTRTFAVSLGTWTKQKTIRLLSSRGFCRLSSVGRLIFVVYFSTVNLYAAAPIWLWIEMYY